jgi:hypothetical protein
MRVILVQRMVTKNEPRLLPSVMRQLVHVANLFQVDLKLRLLILRATRTRNM